MAPSNYEMIFMIATTVGLISAVFNMISNHIIAERNRIFGYDTEAERY